jgi:hypothetical protein
MHFIEDILAFCVYFAIARGYVWVGERFSLFRPYVHTTHASLSPIRRGFVPGFVNYKKGCTWLSATNDKVYQWLAHGRWFSLGTPASSTTKTGHHDHIAESGVKHQKSIKKINQSNFPVCSKCSKPCLWIWYKFFIILGNQWSLWKTRCTYS